MCTGGMSDAERWRSIPGSLENMGLYLGKLLLSLVLSLVTAVVIRRRAPCHGDQGDLGHDSRAQSPGKRTAPQVIHSSLASVC